MTRDEIVEVMARALCPSVWESKRDNIENIDAARADWMRRATAALSALEAAGMRVVPMREVVMCSACGSHVGCDCTRMGTGTANWMTIADAEALAASQEDGQ